MSMYLVTGVPGTGKTYHCVRKMLRAIERGQFVASNVELRPGWAKILARRRRPWYSAAQVDKLADKYDSLLYTTSNLRELMALRLPPCRKCKACKEGRPCQKEGRGIVVLDESHEWLSVRKGTGDKEADKDEKELRKELVTWSSHHRKFGWHVYLVTQDEMRIDSHVRGNAEFKCKLKNLKNVPILGLKPFPNLFVVHTYWHGASRKNERVKMEMYTLNKKRAGLYDTMASPVLNLGIDADGVIPLPLTRLQRAARGTAPEIRPTVVEKLKEKRKIAA